MEKSCLVCAAMGLGKEKRNFVPNSRLEDVKSLTFFRTLETNG